MRSDCIALSALRPLVKRPGGLLDLALLLILAELADARGIVRSLPGQPLTKGIIILTLGCLAGSSQWNM